MTRIIKT